MRTQDMAKEAMINYHTVAVLVLKYVSFSMINTCSNHEIKEIKMSEIQKNVSHDMRVLTYLLEKQLFAGAGEQ